MSHRVILTEGDGDDAFFTELLRVSDLSAEFTIHRRGHTEAERQSSIPPQAGIDSFERYLRAIRTGSQIVQDSVDVSLVVLVADSDEDATAQFNKVKTQLQAATNYTIPSAPLEVSAEEAGKTRSTVLLLPWPDEFGSLETICFELASEKRPEIAKCVASFVGCVRASPPEWKTQSLAKLKLRCQIAASCPKDPNTGLQWTWKTRSGSPPDLIPVNLNNNRVARIMDYLKNVANLSPPPAS